MVLYPSLPSCRRQANSLLIIILAIITMRMNLGPLLATAHMARCSMARRLLPSMLEAAAL